MYLETGCMREVTRDSPVLLGQWLPGRGWRTVLADFQKALLASSSLTLTYHPLHLLNPLGALAVLLQTGFSCI